MDGEFDKKHTYVLKKDGKIIAKLLHTETDQPWIICRFETTPEFEQYRSLFDEEFARQYYDVQPAWGFWDEEAARHGIEFVPLAEKGTEWISGYRLLNISGNKAWFQPIFRKRTWELRRGEILLGRLKVSGDQDMGWYTAYFESRQAFDPYRTLFEEGADIHANEDDEQWLAWQERVLQAELRLVRLLDNTSTTDFLMYVDGSKAKFCPCFNP